MFTCIKQSTYYFDVSFLRNFMKIIFKESYLTNITHL